MNRLPPPSPAADAVTGARRWPAIYLQLLRPQRQRTLALLGLSLAGMALQVPLPFLVANIVDGLAHVADLSDMAPKIGWVTALSIAALALSTSLQILGARLATGFVRHARITCFESLQAAPSARLRDFDISDLQARMIGDLQSLNHLLPTGLVNASRHVIFVLVFGGILIHLSPLIVACIAGFLPLAALVFRAGSRRLSVLSSESYRGNASLNATLLESLQGLRESRVTGARSFHNQRLQQSLVTSQSRGLRAHRHGALLGGALGLVPIAVAAVIWIVGGAKVSAGEMSVGQMISFLMVLSMLYGPINGLFAAASGIVQEQVALRRVADILTLGTPAPAPQGSAAPARGATTCDGPPAVELRGLCFDYGGRPVIQALDAVVPAGSVTVLTGHNGAGKSTLAALIAGLEEPARGQILLDGVDMSALPEPVRRNALGLLSQQAQMFAGSLRVNITLGRSLTDEHIRSLATDMALDSFLDEWPGGLDGAVQETGRDLSGGQRQKIALLRAMAHRPRLLVLDEPENNLDAATVARFADYLERHKGERTVVLISHGSAFRHLADVVIDLSGSAADRADTAEAGRSALAEPAAQD